MKIKKITALLLGFIGAIAFAACADEPATTGNPAGDVVRTEVTAEEWNAAMELNVENYHSVATARRVTAQAEETQRMIINKTATAYSEKAGMLEDGELTDVSERYYQKDGEKYYAYYQEDEQWIKDEITQIAYEESVANEFLSTNFTFTSFTYNAETKSYESLEGAFETWRMADIVFAFEDGKVTKAAFTRTLEDANIYYDFTYEYGNAQVTLPQVTEKVDDTEVTAEEWATAMELNFDNYTMSQRMKYGGQTQDVTIVVDGNLIYHKGERELYLEKDGDTYYEYVCEDDEWHKYPVTERYYNDYADASLASGFIYDDFTYNSSTKAYECATASVQDITNAMLTFLNNRLMSATFTMGPVQATVTLTYGDANVTLPQVVPFTTIKDDDMLADAFSAALDVTSERTVYLAMIDESTQEERQVYEVRVKENAVYMRTPELELVYQKTDDGEIYEYMKQSGQSWTKTHRTGASYRPWEYLVNSAVTMQGHGEYAVGTDSLEAPTIYNATEKCYAYTVDDCDYQAYFVNGKLMKLEVFQGGVKWLVFTYDYEVEEIQIPEV